MVPGYFQPEQAREVARAFSNAGVEYMFIGKSGAILLGYPSATQDVDLSQVSSAVPDNTSSSAKKITNGDVMSWLQ